MLYYRKSQTFNILQNIFEDKLTRQCTKWDSYFKIYERHLSAFRNQAITLIEIGVSQGGGLEMWKAYLGEESTIVGVEIDENCLLNSGRSRAVIEHGSQSDLAFLKRLIIKHGAPNIVIDDGSHIRKDIITTMNFFLPIMPKGSVYLIEDLHGTFWGERCTDKADDSIFTDLMQVVNTLNAPGSRGHLSIDDNYSNVYSITFYWSVIAINIERQPQSYNCLASINGQQTLISKIDARANE